MATALDIVTGGGRVRLTLGAGTQENHATTYGMQWGTPGQRVDGLVDTINILRGMWSTDGPFSYEGKRYSVDGAVLDPKPLGPIPIFIGARMPRTLRIAGSMADGWLKNGGWPESPEAYAELQEAVDRAAEKAGRDATKIRRVVNCTAYVGDKDPASVMPSTFGSAGGLMGTPDQVFDIIDKHRKAGVDTFHVQFANDIIDDQVPSFGEQVIRKLR
jgi:alkanesulfonate monooxygenase SsuD/methylene tetrahydromethanopterin reductase-like flavin-dependent oxidoreductase (luciferase family)